MSLQFVALGAAGNEVEWIDPYISHELVSQAGGSTLYRVEQEVYTYEVLVPKGGSFVIREISDGNE